MIQHLRIQKRMSFYAIAKENNVLFLMGTCTDDVIRIVEPLQLLLLKLGLA
jgi:hypothetical protein